MKEKLNGYWVEKENPDNYIYVEKVFKKGYVTALSYFKVNDKEVIGPTIKLTHKELKEKYTKR